jgi:hypothetical protein
MQSNTLDFGFNIITEKITDPKFDKKFCNNSDDKQNFTLYTKSAQILQSILEYSIKPNDDVYFKSEDISEKHLLKECRYYTRFYECSKTNIPSRVREINQDVSNALERLTYLELLDSEHDVKNSPSSKKYKFSRFGRLIGFLISFKKDKSKVSQNIYNCIYDFYDGMDHSYAKFCSIFFKKCENSPISHKTIDLLVDLLDNVDNDKDLFISQIKKFTPDLNKETWKIWYDSFYDLDEKHVLKYDVLIYNFKLYLEDINKAKGHLLNSFEKLQFSNRDDQFIVTLEGRCNKCAQYTTYQLDVIGYIRSFANADKYIQSNHMNAKCGNLGCKNGFVDFEFIANAGYLIDKQVTADKKKKKIKLRLFKDEVDIPGTVFERIDEGKGDFSSRAKLRQAILIFLYDNPQRPFTKRALQNRIIEERPDLFDYDSSINSSTRAENQNEQFTSRLGELECCQLIQYNRIPSGRNKNVIVKEYELSKFGKDIALATKEKLYGCSPAINEDAYQRWQIILNDYSFSLDFFCKNYFQLCDESGFLDNFVKTYNKYYLDKHEIFSSAECFTQVILFRFEDDGSKNKKLWDLWKSALISLGEHRNLFFNHLKTHFNSLVERMVNNFAKHEDARFKNRFNCKFVTIEASCKKCVNEYIYLQVPIIYYLKGYFYHDYNILNDYAITTFTRCPKCKSNDFSFIDIL